MAAACCNALISVLATAEQLQRFEVLERRLVPGIELQGLLELRQGFIGFALSGECHAEVQMAERIIRPQRYLDRWPAYMAPLP